MPDGSGFIVAVTNLALLVGLCAIRLCVVGTLRYYIPAGIANKVSRGRLRRPISTAGLKLHSHGVLVPSMRT